MAGKKDKAVVAIISGLTDNQATQITKDILKSKQKNAPLGRGTVASGFMSSIGALLQKGTKQIGGGWIWQGKDRQHTQRHRRLEGKETGMFVRYVVRETRWKVTT